MVQLPLLQRTIASGNGNFTVTYCLGQLKLWTWTRKIETFTVSCLFWTVSNHFDKFNMFFYFSKQATRHFSSSLMRMSYAWGYRDIMRGLLAFRDKCFSLLNTFSYCFLKSRFYLIFSFGLTLSTLKINKIIL